jgi:RNA polymerase sigma-70 factor (ECF subfamily)
MRQTTDNEIKEALKLNISKGFELLYDYYYDDLCVYAHRFYNDLDDAQDLVQQTMIKLWSQSEKLIELDYLRSYLYRSVHNAGLNSIRDDKMKALTVSEEYLHDQQWEFTDELISQEQCLYIEEAIAALPNQCRKVLEMNRLQGLSYKEIAEILQISHRTVDTHLTNAVRVLRQKLKGITAVTAFGIIILLLSRK